MRKEFEEQMAKMKADLASKASEEEQAEAERKLKIEMEFKLEQEKLAFAKAEADRAERIRLEEIAIKKRQEENAALDKKLEGAEVRRQMHAEPAPKCVDGTGSTCSYRC